MKLTYTNDPSQDLQTIIASSRWGRIEVSYDGDSIHECSFTAKPASKSPGQLPAHVRTFLKEWDAFGVSGAGGEGFSGRFVAKGTEFEHEAWKALREVKFGRTSTYGEIARKIGRPGAARAIGLACNRNPLPLLIPCHRIVGAGGKLTGFAGGLDVKEKLLAMESSELPLGRVADRPVKRPLERMAANG